MSRNRIDPSIKIRVVEDYLDGKGSFQTIAEKYKLRSCRQLEVWVKKYNSHEDFRKISSAEEVT
jgi:transposase